jgi:hypothetical protein
MLFDVPNLVASPEPYLDDGNMRRGRDRIGSSCSRSFAGRASRVATSRRSDPDIVAPSDPPRSVNEAAGWRVATLRRPEGAILSYKLTASPRYAGCTFQAHVRPALERNFEQAIYLRNCWLAA